MRSIKRPSKHEELVRRLADTAHPVSKRAIFPTMRELMCFAAVLGFHEGDRTRLDGKVLEINGRIFDNSEQAIDLIYLLALASSKDITILHPDREDEMLTFFEEYAATGLQTLEKWMNEKADDPYGDQAIFAALRKYDFIGRPTFSADAILERITF